MIAISDANFGRYHITAQDLKRVMDRNDKVQTALICIGEGAEAAWYCVSFEQVSTNFNLFARIPKNFQGRGYRVSNTHDIPKVLRSILSSMVEK